MTNIRLYVVTAIHQFSRAGQQPTFIKTVFKIGTVQLLLLTTFRPIRIRSGSAHFCSHTTPLLFVDNTS